MKRLPVSGNAGLAASALIQAALGFEFLLSGLNKVADGTFVRNFRLFVDSSPGTHSGLLRPLVQGVIQPNIALFAELTRVSELALGTVLLIGAVEVGRRRLSGTIGRPHSYEAPVALIAALAGLGTAFLSLTIALLMGEGLPSVMPGRALTTAVPVELLLVPLGLAVTWMETGRFLALRRSKLLSPVVSLPAGTPVAVPVPVAVVHRASRAAGRQR